MTRSLLAGAMRAVALAAAAKRLDGLDVLALVIAAGLVALGVRSFLRWLRSGFEPSSTGESVLYALHVTARVGTWFAFAGAFAGYAVVADPQAFRWYVMVPLGLAAIQFVTAVLLGQDRRDPHASDD